MSCGFLERAALAYYFELSPGVAERGGAPRLKILMRIHQIQQSSKNRRICDFQGFLKDSLFKLLQRDEQNRFFEG